MADEEFLDSNRRSHTTIPKLLPDDEILCILSCLYIRCGTSKNQLGLVKIFREGEVVDLSNRCSGLTPICARTCLFTSIKQPSYLCRLRLRLSKGLIISIHPECPLSMQAHQAHSIQIARVRPPKPVSHC